MNDNDLITTVQQLIDDTIPLAAHTGLRITTWQDDELLVHVPLAPNTNDKGCAFAGAMVSTMTVGCWALASLSLLRRNLDCDVFVATSSVRYSVPVWADFDVSVGVAAKGDLTAFTDATAARGKGKVELRGDIRETGSTTTCATFQGLFVAHMREPSPADAPRA